MLGNDCPEIFSEFRRVMDPLRDRILYYLFQFPPGFGTSRTDHLISFLKQHCRNAALEFRDPAWYEEDILREIASYGLPVSPDSPKIRVILHGDTLYLRLHGRKRFYRHDYTQEELKEILTEIKKRNYSRCLVFFNNTVMFDNALQFMELAKS